MDSAEGGYQRVDESCIQELRELTSFNENPGRFENLIETFLDSLEPQVALMRKVLEDRDPAELAELADLAHTLKGTAASMGAIILARLCSTLEEICTSLDLDLARSEVQEIESEAL